MVLICAAPALSADPAAIAKAHSAAFQKAFEACNIPAVLALYEDGAVAIWPGQGEVARGRQAIGKLVAANCKSAKPALRLKSQDSRAAGKDYILNVGEWENTVTGADGKPVTMELRTTEVLHRSHGKWRYVIDHASVGLPPPRAAASSSSGKSASH